MKNAEIIAIVITILTIAILITVFTVASIYEAHDRIDTLEEKVETLEVESELNKVRWDKQTEINRGILDILEILIP